MALPDNDTQEQVRNILAGFGESAETGITLTSTTLLREKGSGAERVPGGRPERVFVDAVRRAAGVAGARGA